jgi:lipopolysaccharide biosynthesis glycosyltransferase
MQPAGFNCSLNIFLYNKTFSKRMKDDLSFLGSIHPEVQIRVRNLSLESLARDAYIDFLKGNRNPHFPLSGTGVELVRLFVPLIFDADWFIYFDDDWIMKRGEFFPEVMNLTFDMSKVLYAVQDQWFVVSSFFRERIKSYKRDFPGLQYYCSGFLMMRNGTDLRQELRKTIQYYQEHMELQYMDQDALNLAFDLAYVQFLPLKYNVMTPWHVKLGDTGYAFHFSGLAKDGSNHFMDGVLRSYRDAKQKWLRWRHRV